MTEAIFNITQEERDRLIGVLKTLGNAIRKSDRPKLTGNVDAVIDSLNALPPSSGSFWRTFNPRTGETTFYNSLGEVADKFGLSLRTLKNYDSLSRSGEGFRNAKDGRFFVKKAGVWVDRTPTKEPVVKKSHDAPTHAPGGFSETREVWED